MFYANIKTFATAIKKIDSRSKYYYEVLWHFISPASESSLDFCTVNLHLKALSQVPVSLSKELVSMRTQDQLIYIEDTKGTSKACASYGTFPFTLLPLHQHVLSFQSLHFLFVNIYPLTLFNLFIIVSRRFYINSNLKMKFWHDFQSIFCNPLFNFHFCFVPS